MKETTRAARRVRKTLAIDIDVNQDAGEMKGRKMRGDAVAVECLYTTVAEAKCHRLPITSCPTLYPVATDQRTDRGIETMDAEASYTCDACGEEIVVPIDLSAGESQQYVEDCPVCCRPNVIHVEIDEDGQPRVWAERE
jgi:hypothetical protein